MENKKYTKVSLTEENFYNETFFTKIDSTSGPAYFILKDKLVPYSFLSRVSNQIKTEFEPGEIIFPEHECTEEFYESLTDNERQVFMDCVLLTVNRRATISFYIEEGSESIDGCDIPSNDTQKEIYILK